MELKEYLKGKGLIIGKDEIMSSKGVHVRINDTFNTLLPWKNDEDGKTFRIPREEFFRLLGGHMLMHQCIISGWYTEEEYDLVALTSIGKLETTPELYFEFSAVSGAMYEEEYIEPTNEESNRADVTTLEGSIYNKEETK